VLFIKSNVWAATFICFVALGAFGAGLKYLETDAQRETARRNDAKSRLNNQEEPLLNKFNPFLPAAQPTATPQLAKEYIYAGSRLLAIEDAKAVAAAPADLAVWRPSTGAWWVMGSGSQQFSLAWGQSGDVPAPGDYDGDGKTDLSVFRPSTNFWWVVRSSDGNYYTLAFGLNGDVPAPADYDGDGKTDIAVFRPVNGTWYINQSSNGVFVQAQFGLSSDIPSPADFDGDGRADLAVWRASNKTFYSKSSSGNQFNQSTFNQASAFPVPADYDGDGRADYAIRSGADWIIRRSSVNQTQTIAWQQANDKPVPNDYDGDGMVDIAVWRESNGNWYIRKSSSNGALRQEAWGTSGDIPVPAFYRR
jgi:hypothetical protein